MEAGHAAVVGSGPNGLAAAITLARAGASVRVLEASDSLGGGTRTLALTLPGFLHDVCSAIHPLAVSSPFFRSVPLVDYGLRWIQPEIACAHPLDDGTTVILDRSLDITAETLGSDGSSYRRLFEPFVREWQGLSGDILHGFRIPRHPVTLVRFGRWAARSATGLVNSLGWGERARALFAGLAAHSVLPLDQSPSAAFGLILGAAGHAAGWPLPAGGSSSIASALVSYLNTLGGQVVAGTPVDSLEQLRDNSVILCDVSPRELLRIAGPSLPAGYRRRLAGYRHGPGAFKIDWALTDPIPWRAPECSRAGTVHVGGTFEEVARSEGQAWNGLMPECPFVLVTQPTVFDPSRAPAGKHVAWAYCHVPNGSDAGMTERIEAQVERFAPGFRETILARSILPPRDLERHNRNLAGGDLSGGANTMVQLLLRPGYRRYSTPLKNVFLCSAATPPGGGVHGMCGYLAARKAIERLR